MPNLDHKVFSVSLAIALSACVGVVSPDGARDDGSSGGGGEEASGGGNNAGSPQTANQGGSGAARPGPPPTTSNPGQLPATRFARLSHFEYANTIKALFGVDASDAVNSLQKDAIVGFDNRNDGVLSVSPELRLDYEKAAETVADRLANDPALLDKFAPTAAFANDGTAKDFFRKVLQRAYRRPATDKELGDVMGVYAAASGLIGSGDRRRDGVRLVTRFLLQSPLLIYRISPQETESSNANFALASRLSFAITASPPDDELLASASEGRLKDAKELEAQARRLLMTEAAERNWVHFHSQLLAFESYTAARKDQNTFPLWKDNTAQVLRKEAEDFSRHILTEDLGFSDLLTSPRVILTKDLATYYGVQAAASPAEEASFRLPQLQRAGILTRGGFLASRAGPKQPDPIHRGVFISHTFLCQALPPPGAVVTPVPDNGGTTNRQRVNAHTGPGTCGQACHAKLINPLGFAFENYDAAGQFRATDNGAPVDASGSYELDGKIHDFSNAIDLSVIIARSQQANACYAANILAFVFGRPTEDADEPFLQAAAEQTVQGASLKDTIVRTVLSSSFKGN